MADVFQDHKNVLNVDPNQCNYTDLSHGRNDLVTKIFKVVASEMDVYPA